MQRNSNTSRHFHQPHEFRRGNRVVSRPPPALPEPEESQQRLESITTASNLQIKRDGDSKIDKVEVVATFNWKDLESPAIIVPGRPPRWQDPVMSRRLKEDDPYRVYYRDINSARYAAFPTEPAIRAIQTLKPEFDISQAEIFGCGNTIGSLLDFVSGVERTFRFGIELIGSTVVLVRKTNIPRETINDINGFGHTFPEAYTTWDRDVKGSDSHQRIVKYNFCGLKCFVRSESDGYFPDLIKSSKASETKEILKLGEVTADIDDLTKLNIAAPGPLMTRTLEIQEAGEMIPQEAVFDLKTRSIKKKPEGEVMVDDEFLRRLWVNQTPNLVLAYHTRGHFDVRDIHIIDVRSKVAAWEESNISVLQQLGGLLHKLVEFARQSGQERFEVRRVGTGSLEFWSEVSDWSALPDDLRESLAVEPEKEESTADQVSGAQSDSTDEKYTK